MIKDALSSGELSLADVDIDLSERETADRQSDSDTGSYVKEEGLEDSDDDVSCLYFMLI